MESKALSSLKKLENWNSIYRFYGDDHGDNSGGQSRDSYSVQLMWMCRKKKKLKTWII